MHSGSKLEIGEKKFFRLFVVQFFSSNFQLPLKCKGAENVFYFSSKVKYTDGST